MVGIVQRVISFNSCPKRKSRIGSTWRTTIRFSLWIVIGGGGSRTSKFRGRIVLFARSGIYRARSLSWHATARTTGLIGKSRDGIYTVAVFILALSRRVTVPSWATNKFAVGVPPCFSLLICSSRCSSCRRQVVLATTSWTTTGRAFHYILRLVKGKGFGVMGCGLRLWIGLSFVSVWGCVVNKVLGYVYRNEWSNNSSCLVLAICSTRACYAARLGDKVALTWCLLMKRGQRNILKNIEVDVFYASDEDVWPPTSLI